MGISKIKKKAVFFDRDGVINLPLIRNGKHHPPKTLKELKMIDNIELLLNNLKNQKFLMFVITNQPDVERGTFEKKDVEEIHDFMLRTLPLEKIYVCYDDGIKKNTKMRKPHPGMLLLARDEYNVDLNTSYLIGDRWRDIDAGIAVGCTTVFIDWGYKEKLNQLPNKTVIDLKSGIDWIVNHDNKQQVENYHAKL